MQGCASCSRCIDFLSSLLVYFYFFIDVEINHKRGSKVEKNNSVGSSCRSPLHPQP